METKTNGEIEDPTIRGVQGEQDFHPYSYGSGNAGELRSGWESLGRNREGIPQRDTTADTSVDTKGNGNKNGLSCRSTRRPKPQTHGGVLRQLISSSTEELADLQQQSQFIESQMALLSSQMTLLSTQLENLSRKADKKTSDLENWEALLRNYEANTVGLAQNQDAPTD